MQIIHADHLVLLGGYVQFKNCCGVITGERQRYDIGVARFTQRGTLIRMIDGNRLSGFFAGQLLNKQTALVHPPMLQFTRAVGNHVDAMCHRRSGCTACLELEAGTERVLAAEQENPKTTVR
jgi:hypothetical protein